MSDAAGAAAVAGGLELGVERSVTGRRWRPRPLDARAALAISQRLGLPEVVGRVLAARSVGPEQAPAYLSPRLREALPEPSRLRDLDAAVARLADAVVAGEPIGLLTDYDVDGATSAALLARYLRAVGAEAAAIEVPERLTEGYGPNRAALARLAARGCRVVATLDCGTTAFDALAGAAAEDRLDVIVVDHHAAEPRLPAAVAVVNPNRLDQQEAGCGHLAAVGVTFLLVVGLNRELRRRGRFARTPEPDLRRWLDLVALGTVADVVPLTGVNRAFVAQGLRVAAGWPNPGLRALAAAAGVLGAGGGAAGPGADDLAFRLGPRLNAGSRLGRSDLALRLLVSDDPGEVAALAQLLDRLNGERRALERRTLAEAEARAAAQLAGDAPLLVVAAEGWSPGVAGLVAGRLVERHHRPAVVIGLAGKDGVGRGSARSVPGFDVGAAVIAARQAGVLQEGGGHPLAAGLTVAADRVAELRAFLADRFGRTAGPAGADRPDPAALELDGALSLPAASVALAELLERLAPYGSGNPEPRFMIAGVRPVRARQAGDGHVACHLAGAATPGGGLKAVAFRSLNTPLGAALLDGSGAPLHVAGRIKLDTWQGRRGVALHIEDAARP